MKEGREEGSCLCVLLSGTPSTSKKKIKNSSFEEGGVEGIPCACNIVRKKGTTWLVR